MTEEERLARLHERASDEFRNELELLFKRFNFFLLASSFLITTLVVAVTSRQYTDGTSCLIPGLASAILVLGGLISMAFLVINYVNAKVARARRDFIENGLPEICGNLPLPDMYSSMTHFVKCKIKARGLLQELLPDFCTLIRDPPAFADREVAFHTWLTPFGFYIFWIFASVWVLREQWCSPWLISVLGISVGLPLGLFLYYVRPWVKSCRLKLRRKK